MAYRKQAHVQDARHRSRRSLLVVLTITLGLLVGAGGSATLAQDESSDTATWPTHSLTRDVPFMAIDGREVYLDIYAPNGEGPWPVVVAFHGLGDRGADDTFKVASDAAAEGILVFVPTWIDEHSFPLTVEGMEVQRQTAGCAVAFAQQRAAAFGGDPERTATYGFSAGYSPAMRMALAPPEDPIPGCATDAVPTRVNGVVAGDGDGFLYGGTFDHVFDADPEATQAHVEVFTDPAVWPSDLDARFFLWTANLGTDARAVPDLADETSWLAQRDPTGSIRADLERLGQLEDGVITFQDAGRLVADRLATVGLDVTLDEYPGGHTTVDKVPELIAYMKAAAE